MEDLGAGKVAGNERLRLVDKAGCQASPLFDTGLAQEHAHLDADAEWREVMAWIARKPLLRHLVVQTLRVLPTVHLAATAQTLDPLPGIGIRVLERFGKDVPTAPSPGSYERLLREVLDAMPDELRARMLSWMQQTA